MDSGLWRRPWIVAIALGPPRLEPVRRNVELISRDRELRQLGDALDGAEAGKGGVLLVAGEAGVGKTQLVRAAVGRSAAPTYWADATQEPTAPYSPIVAILRSYLRDEPRGFDELGPIAAPLRRLLPELCGEPDADERASLIDALVCAFESFGRARPRVVVLDDLQWADSATVELLPALAAALDEAAVLVLGVYRSDEIPRGHRLRKVRADLRRAGRFDELVVDPLDVAGTSALAARVLGGDPGPALGAALYDRTQGIPFFVEELAAAIAGGGMLRQAVTGFELAEGEPVPLPETVRDAVLLRVDQLGGDARAALEVAAVAGLRFELELVGDLTDASALLEPLARGLVVEVEPGFAAFRHALAREALYAEVPWPRRRRLHREIAERLAARRAPPRLVAEHWLAAREPEQARPALISAAEASFALHAYRDGARALKLALELWPDGVDEPGRLDALARLAECAEVAGDLGEAARAWREVADGQHTQGEPAGLGEVLRRLAGTLELQGRWEDALGAREQAAASFEAAARPADAVAERLAAAAHLRSASGFRAALALLENARAEAHAAARPDLEARVLGLEGNVRVRMGEGSSGLELVRAGLTLALEHNLSGAAAEIYQRLADSLEHIGDYRAARETYDEAYAYCAASALEPTAQLCLACLTVVLRQTGDWDHAASLSRSVLASEASTPHARTVALGTLGFVLGVRGQARASRRLLLESTTLARHIELAAMELLSGWALAVLDYARSPAAARERCLALLERWRETEERHYAISPLRWAATVFAEAEDAENVQACAAALTVITSETGQPEALSALAHALGELALVEGESERAVEQFDRALTLLADGSPFERAESQRRAAAALVAAGRSDDAVERLVSAHRVARRLGAAPLAARLAAELAGLGEKVERHLGRRAAGELERGGLSRRELEVVRLFAVGQTNREIARELFLSPRTVDMHVRNVLSKLDCRSRADASRRAGELGLLERAPS